MIEIIPYSDNYKEEFKRINLEWLEEYKLTESHDLMVLNDPSGTILSNGGFIWLTKVENEIVGSAAIMNEGDAVFELAKMCVTVKWRGKGISRILLETCLAKAKEMGAKKIILYSNYQLKTALGLYEKYGFKHVEVKDAPFLTADVKMELHL